MLAESATRSVTRVAPPLARRLPVLHGRSTSSSLPGSPCIRGANGQGKTSLLEAVAWIATRATRSAASPTRRSCATGASRRSCAPRSSTTTRVQLFEAEIRVERPQPHPVQQAARSRARRDLHGLLRVTVFAPDDLALVKGGPSARRDVPRRAARRCSRRATTRRAPTSSGCCKQRNALLRVGRPRRRRPRTTLDVFDDQLVRAGGRAGARPAAAGRPARAGRRRGLRGAGRRRPAGGRGATRPSGRRARSASADADAVEGYLRDALAARRRAEIDRGRHARRPAPRRLAARRSTGSTRARRRRRGSSARSRSRCGWPATASCTSSPAPRRCCCSTTCSASSTPRRAARAGAQPARRPDAADDRGRDPAGRRARPACCASTRGRVERGSARDEPRARSRRAGAARRRARGGRPRARHARARRARARSSTRGPRSSAPRVAAHARVRSVRDGVCTVAVDDAGVGDPAPVPRTAGRASAPERAADRVS